MLDRLQNLILKIKFALWLIFTHTHTHICIKVDKDVNPTVIGTARTKFDSLDK